jgi:signal transduction histidine kinase
MKPKNILTIPFRKIAGNFAAKIFITHAISIVIVSVVFTGYFIHHGRKTMKETLLNKGDLLVRQLADTSRIGVFAESAALLSDPISLALTQKEALSARVYTRSGKLLGQAPSPASAGYQQQKDLTPGDISEIERSSRSTDRPVYHEKGQAIEFWAPIMTIPRFSSSEALIFTDSPVQTTERIIGFAAVTLSTNRMDAAFRDLMLRSVFICMAFLSVALGGAYFLARSITRPINSLKASVNALGAGIETERIPIDTADEIGDLSRAFNNMAESLRLREAEKEHLSAQLQHAQKIEAIGQLAGGVAHDFNNILCAIIGFGALLEMSMKPDDPSRQHLEQILAAADRATSLTHGLLAFSRKQVINLRRTDLNTVVRNVEKMLKRLISEDIDLRLCLTCGELPVLVDTGQIDHVLINLATNASDAMPQGGMLTISTMEAVPPDNFLSVNSISTETRYALLTVADTGTGMESETREKVFEPFFTTKEVGKGTGLGLSMAYGIVKQHSGHIDVISAPGKGTVFSIYLPMADADAPASRRVQSASEFAGGTETLLVVEDNLEVRNLNRMILETYGYRVLEAVDGEEAIAQFMRYEDEIDLVVMDVVMPKVNGRQAQLEISRIRPGIKVIFMSGYTADIIRDKGIATDGFTLIQKPLTPLSLLKKVREVLDS